MSQMRTSFGLTGTILYDASTVILPKFFFLHFLYSYKVYLYNFTFSFNFTLSICICICGTSLNTACFVQYGTV